MEVARAHVRIFPSFRVGEIRLFVRATLGPWAFSAVLSSGSPVFEREAVEHGYSVL